MSIKKIINGFIANLFDYLTRKIYLSDVLSKKEKKANSCSSVLNYHQSCLNTKSIYFYGYFLLLFGRLKICHCKACIKYMPIIILARKVIKGMNQISVEKFGLENFYFNALL